MKIEEWLLAGEYVLSNNNPNLIFCERGIRTFETYTRNTLDLSTIPIIKNESHCPIMIDPSQGVGAGGFGGEPVPRGRGHGRRRAVDRSPSQSRPKPGATAAQQLTLEGFARLMEDLRPFIAAAGRE